MNVRIADGGAERFESVAIALAMLPADADFVAIHDAVRPCITDALIRFKNNRLRVASELGISRMTLYKKLHKYGLING